MLLVNILRTDTAYICAKFATMEIFNRAFKSGDADASHGIASWE